MAIQFQFRRGLAADWTSANTILASGEMGLETDTNKFKIGNGTLGWNSLPYASGPSGPTGPAGTNGLSITGPTGPAGVGVTGPAGATGPAGTPGDNALNRKVIDDAFLGTSFYFKKTSFSSTVTSTVIPPISLI